MIVERCNDWEEALSLASMARRAGLMIEIATPRTHGFWGIVYRGATARAAALSN